MRGEGIEIVRLKPEHADALGRLLKGLSENRDEMWFHPHPLTPEYARVISEREGKDLYYLALSKEEAIGYGMLRGWDEGFKVPSLGIAIHPKARGKGLGRTLMEFLHAAAREHGAPSVRLKVHEENSQALELYRSLGYRFEGKEGDQWVCYFDLP